MQSAFNYDIVNIVRFSQDIFIIGNNLYTQLGILFILLGFVLLAAMVCAIILALITNMFVDPNWSKYNRGDMPLIILLVVSVTSCVELLVMLCEYICSLLSCLVKVVSRGWYPTKPGPSDEYIKTPKKPTSPNDEGDVMENSGLKTEASDNSQAGSSDIEPNIQQPS